MGLKPGQKAPASGQYGVIGPRGGKTNHEVTAVKGKPIAWSDLYHERPHKQQVRSPLKLNMSTS